MIKQFLHSTSEKRSSSSERLGLDMLRASLRESHFDIVSIPWCTEKDHSYCQSDEFAPRVRCNNVGLSIVYLVVHEATMLTRIGYFLFCKVRMFLEPKF